MVKRLPRVEVRVVVDDPIVVVSVVESEVERMVRPVLYLRVVVVAGVRGDVCGEIALQDIVVRLELCKLGLCLGKGPCSGVILILQVVVVVLQVIVVVHEVVKVVPADAVA